MKFDKKDEFIIYIGSHGDEGAQIADIVLPGSAYTEQDGYFTNLEGKIQKAYKASFPPGDAKEDWEIINELSELLKRKKLFKNKDELTDSMFNFLKIKNKDDNQNNQKYDFINETISLDYIDYYFSNVICRASKTMSECRKIKLNNKLNGTDN